MTWTFSIHFSFSIEKTVSMPAMREKRRKQKLCNWLHSQLKITPLTRFHSVSLAKVFFLQMHNGMSSVSLWSSSLLFQLYHMVVLAAVGKKLSCDVGNWIYNFFKFCFNFSTANGERKSESKMLCIIFLLECGLSVALHIWYISLCTADNFFIREWGARSHYNDDGRFDIWKILEWTTAAHCDVIELCTR